MTEIETETVSAEGTSPAPAPKAKKRKGVPSKKAAKGRKGKAAIAVVKPARGKPVREDLQLSDMTVAEVKMLRVLYTPKGPREGKPLHILQKEVFGTKGTSETRNTLRRLVKFGWLEQQDHTKLEIAKHAAEGGRLYSKYRLSEKGRKRGIKD